MVGPNIFKTARTVSGPNLFVSNYGPFRTRTFGPERISKKPWTESLSENSDLTKTVNNETLNQTGLVQAEILNSLRIQKMKIMNNCQLGEIPIVPTISHSQPSGEPLSKIIWKKLEDIHVGHYCI